MEPDRNAGVPRPPTTQNARRSHRERQHDTNGEDRHARTTRVLDTLTDTMQY
jgi:hypothetical protein